MNSDSPITTESDEGALELFANTEDQPNPSSQNDTKMKQDHDRDQKALVKKSHDLNEIPRVIPKQDAAKPLVFWP